MKSTYFPAALWLAALTMVTLLSGCPASMSASDYSREQARSAQNVQSGIVQSVREVRIEGTKSGIGTLAGGAIGGVLGNQIGAGAGRTLATIGVGLAGAAAGSAVEEGTTRQRGLEVTVRLDNGRTVAVTQAADVSLVPGDRVRVLTDRYGTARIVR
ncbi:MAG: glycine zipper 2TM domain-containing protein [Halochromatium sp.]